MKKKILALCLVVALLATAIAGATLAYFTDNDEVENTFTMGNVKIDLFETEDGIKTDEGIDFEEAIVPGHEFPKDPTVQIKKGSQNSYLFLDVTLNKYRSLAPVMALDAVADENIAFTQADFNACLEGNTFKATKFLAWGEANLPAFRTIINKWFGGIVHENWKIVEVYPAVAKDDVKTAGNWLTVRLAYIGAGDPILSAEEEVTFMTSFQMPASVTQEMIENDYTANNFNTEKVPFYLNLHPYASQADTQEPVDDACAALFAD